MVVTCYFCRETGPLEDFQMDTVNKLGFWCEWCDGFTYFEEKMKERHRFTLILEDKEAEKPKVGAMPIKLKKSLSPLRYPGGKTRLVDYLYKHLQQENSKTLISPFTGGGSFELAMLDAGVVEQLHLNDLDYGVYSLWWTMLHAPYALIDKLQRIQPTHADYFRAQAMIKQDYRGLDAVDAAWATLLVNRTAYSGIVKANPLGGKNGTKEALLSRWNPKALIEKINHIHSLSDRIQITQEDAAELIEESYWLSNATIFIDPPYVEKGKDLYHCYYTERNHVELSTLLDSLHQGMPGADIVVTYDYNEWLQAIYEYPETVVIGRNYSI